MPAGKGGAKTLRASAPVFAALGDQTRLELISRLSAGSALSISRLTEGTDVTRQAITKHLRVLQQAGLVTEIRSGRETLFSLEPKRITEAHRALDMISKHWDAALERLRA